MSRALIYDKPMKKAQKDRRNRKEVYAIWYGLDCKYYDVV